MPLKGSFVCGFFLCLFFCLSRICGSRFVCLLLYLSQWVYDCWICIVVRLMVEDYNSGSSALSWKCSYQFCLPFNWWELSLFFCKKCTEIIELFFSRKAYLSKTGFEKDALESFKRIFSKQQILIITKCWYLWNGDS